MTSAEKLPEDPTFPPSSYARIALLLRSGVVGFLLLASAGLGAYLSQHPNQSVGAVLSTGPGPLVSSPVAFVHGLGALDPTAIVLLGIYLMIAVTIVRVLVAAWDFARGRERTLAAIAAAVAVLLIVGLFVVAPIVH